ncbi:MAG: copper resistance protein B [Proteobacteria bacterium]|nr:copper resistance protein B [Pseudomonadota bacterium]
MRRGCVAAGFLCAFMVASFLTAPEHVSAQEMDNAIFHHSMLDVDAASSAGSTVGRWNASGWIGTDFDRLWWSTSGEGAESELDEFETMLLYGHYARRFWDIVVGYRHDFKPTSQGYLTVGLMGLAPYWFEVGLFGFVSDSGKPSLRLDAENDLYLTQRLVLTLEGEVDWLLTADDELDLAAGIASLGLGLRTRYEIRRKFAPYVDLTWVREKDLRTPVPGGIELNGLRIGAGLRLIY